MTRTLRECRNFLGAVCAFAAAAAPAFAQWTNGQDAQYVIGQSNFTTMTGGCAVNKMQEPFDVAVDVAHSKLYVADLVNRRVLRFAYPVTANNPDAELVFGQSDFTTNTAWPVAADRLAPSSVAVDADGNLWVGDGGYRRVVAFFDAHLISTNKPTADLVLGAPDFVTSAFGTTQSKVGIVREIALDSAGNLFVVDGLAHRVLRWNNAASLASGAAADGVLGQADFTATGSGLSATAMNNPIGLAMSGTSLFVCEFMNQRILRFDNAASKANGAAADGVLGQENFTSNVEATTQDGVNDPYALAVDGHGRLYVGEDVNKRVLVFEDAVNKADGANADFVLGQEDFTTVDFGPTAQDRLYYPHGLDVDSTNGKLIVSDMFRSRIMIFAASSGLPVTTDSFDVE